MGCGGSKLDAWFSYNTAKVVRIKDRRLGFIYITVLVLIVAYISLYVFFYNKGYLLVQSTKGEVATKTKGVAYASGQPSSTFFDESDIIHPPLEAGAIFLVTRIQRTLSQQRGWCLPIEKPMICKYDSDCFSTAFPQSGRCDSRKCMFYQWCPPEDPTNATITSDVFINGFENFTIWFKASIRFDLLGTDDKKIFFSTIKSSQPVSTKDDPKHANLFSVSELINKLPLQERNNMTAIRYTGLILKVRINWECDIDKSEYESWASVDRLDNSVVNDGFNYRMANPYRVSVDNVSVEKRDLIKYYGIRSFVESSGSGHKLSLSAIILNIAGGIALFGVATVFVDILATRLLPESEIYTRCKFEDTAVLYNSASDEDENKQLCENMHAEQKLKADSRKDCCLQHATSI